MAGANLNQRWARALVGAIAASGAREAVVCPGSRSAALALACADHPGLRTWSVIDERSAGFFALGIAKLTRQPVVLVATSGTAPAHFYPAIIEASLSGLPLVVLSADRPWELHGFGAPQTIDQHNLFGRYVRRFEALPVPEETTFAHLDAVVQRAMHSALSSPRGPVHLNAPFRDPLAPTPDSDAEKGFADAAPPLFARSERVPSDGELRLLRARIEAVRDGLIICAPRDGGDDFAQSIRALSSAAQYPVFAEAASQARSVAAYPGLVTRYDALLLSDRFAEFHRPKLVLRFGGGITSKRLQQWLDRCGAEIIQFSDEGEPFDPAHKATRVIVGDAHWIASLLARQKFRDASDWLAKFAAVQQRAEAELDQAFGEAAALTEPRIAREVLAAMPKRGVLFVSSSMPIRDVDAFGAETPGVTVLSNRGANGIDGVIASALGASASADRPTTVLLGDLAFLHDVGSLLIACRHRVPLTVVVVNNDGGGIFSFLPIAKHRQHYEQLFGTPHGLNFEASAQQYGARYARPANVAELRVALANARERRGLTVVEVATGSRADNVSIHDALGERIARAASGMP